MAESVGCTSKLKGFRSIFKILIFFYIGGGLMLDKANYGQRGVISWTALYFKKYFWISNKKALKPIMLLSSVY